MLMGNLHFSLLLRPALRARTDNNGLRAKLVNNSISRRAEMRLKANVDPWAILIDNPAERRRQIKRASSGHEV